MARAGAAMFFLPKVRAQLAAEIEAQFAAFDATGLKLDHVNAHKHFHLHPTIAALMVKLGKRAWRQRRAGAAGAAGVLRQIEPHRATATVALTAPFARALRGRFRRAGIAAPDQVFGLAWSGRDDGRARLSGTDRTSARRAFGDLSASRHGPYPGSAPGYALCRGTCGP